MDCFPAGLQDTPPLIWEFRVGIDRVGQGRSHSKEMNDDPPATPLNMSGYTETNNHQI